MTSPVPQKPVRAHQLEVKIDLNSSARVPPAFTMKLVTVFALVNDGWIMNMQYSLVTKEIMRSRTSRDLAWGKQRRHFLTFGACIEAMASYIREVVFSPWNCG